MTTEFHSSYVGIGLMLNMPEIERVLLQRAELVRAEAERTAPVGDEATDPHPGLYRDSFETALVPRGGGRRHDRPQAVVRNIQPYALIVEKGTSQQVGYHTLVRALQVAR